VLPHEGEEIEHPLCEAVPPSFLPLVVGRGVRWLEEGLEDAELVEGLLLLGEMLLDILDLGEQLGLGFVLLLGHVLYLRLESHILRLYCPRVLSLLQIDLVGEAPSQYFDAALVEEDIEGLFLHFEGVLVVEEGIEGVDEGD
jgi:hypothetical protein